jgi:hypothetical protein
LNDVYAFFENKFSDESIKTAQDSSQSMAKQEQPIHIPMARAVMSPRVFYRGGLSDANGWQNMMARLASMTEQDQSMQSLISRGGLLAPETTMYMAALNISEDANEKSGASLWLENEQKKDQNRAYQQKISNYAGF